MSGAGRAALALCRWVGAAVDPGFCCHRAIVLEGEAHREGLGCREGEAHRESLGCPAFESRGARSGVEGVRLDVSVARPLGREGGWGSV